MSDKRYFLKFCCVDQSLSLHSIAHFGLRILFIIVVSQTVTAQSGDKAEPLNSIFDQSNTFYGPNDFLERGLVYIPENPKATGHPFLTDQDWNMADIRMLGNTFKNVAVKYNIEQDILILRKHIQGSDVNLPILLNSAQIDQFRIDSHTFSNLSRIDSTHRLKGFGELLFNGEFLAYRKYAKIFRNQYSRTNPFGFYTKLTSDIYIQWNGHSTKITNNRSLKNTFNLPRQPLKKKMRDMHFKFKKTTEDEFIELLKWCNAQLSENGD
jgi:hypothetical protein